MSQRVSVVTGAGRGIGLAFATALAARGDRVFATVRDRARADELTALGDAVELVVLDADDPRSFGAAAAEIGSKVSSVDLVVHNAGINAKALPNAQKNVAFGDLEAVGIAAMVRVNAIAPLLFTQALAAHLTAGSKVVCVSSSMGSIGRKTSGGNYGYAASKAALNMIVRLLGFDLAPRGVVALAVDPGWVRTAMGGDHAPLSAEESVAAMLAFADRATLAESGGFFDRHGVAEAW